ncbi:CBS domain-containing protein CBSCBSPB3-like isoform X2 [Salvia miltiorrhiza]|uniref:CBS domain-containing protein CBSCBSPB3-like isoform X2 n=1 Tax=Salvia miltiorrhiza TaxID=226208 RepID=UPI0025AD339F|nr:CBS domain-containing protein CBSCBSPB3-like isoform X2 [Salvia miltiorrhiza]
MAESRIPVIGEGERTLKNLQLSKKLTVSEGTTVLDVCKRMAAICVDAVLVNDTNNLVSGIVTDKDIMTRVVAKQLKPDRTLISEVMTRDRSIVSSNAPIIEALQITVIGNCRHLPVFESDQIIALLDITSCLDDTILSIEKYVKKKSVMTARVYEQGHEHRYGNDLPEIAAFEGIRDRLFRSSVSTIILEPYRVATVSPSDTVYVAAKKMRDSWVNYVLIMTGNNIRGILTSKDILMRVVAQNLSPEVTLVEKVMTPDPKCTTLDTTILEVLYIMRDGKFAPLPVVDKDGNVAACVDVLQITKRVIYELENILVASTEAAITVMETLMDSKLILKPSDDGDTQSKMTFFFKLEDHKGCVHRFNLVTDNLAKLASAVMQRAGVYDDQKGFQLLYEDDEGDKIVLTTDGDLVAAVSQAKSMGHKVLRIHLQYYDSRQEMKELSSTTMTTIERSEETKVLSSATLTTAERSGWALGAILVVVGFLAIYLFFKLS